FGRRRLPDGPIRPPGKGAASPQAAGRSAPRQVMTHETRIAHIAPQLDTGGMERLLAEFARHADTRRFSLRFVSLAGEGADGPVAADIASRGWPVTALNARAGTRPSIIFRLARLFRSERIRVVHTHNTRALLYAGPAA